MTSLERIELLQNYEVDKLYIPEVSLYNYVLLLSLLVVAIGTLRKQKSATLDKVQTDQLRGLAILLIIIYHWAEHVSLLHPNALFSHEGISLFFLLSAFGLRTTMAASRFSISAFLNKRLKRVFLPYWVTTGLFVVLDLLLLHRTYSFQEFGLTILGMNFSEVLGRIDYVRWFITLLLFWYVAFLMIHQLRISDSSRVMIMFILGGTLFLTDHYWMKLFWDEIFSFPAGYCLGVYAKSVKQQFEKHSAWTWIGLGIVAISIIVLYKQFVSVLLLEHLPSIGGRILAECTGIVFSLAGLSIMTGLGRLSIVSTALLTTGAISYELFLLHGAFMVKYSFIVPGTYMLASCYVYLIVLVCLSLLFKKVITTLTEGRRDHKTYALGVSN